MLGDAARSVGRLEDARRWLDEGLERAEATLGPAAELRVGLATERIHLALDLGETQDAQLRAEALWTVLTQPMAPATIRVPAARAYAAALTEPDLAATIRRQGVEACGQLKHRTPDCDTLDAAEQAQERPAGDG